VNPASKVTPIVSDDAPEIAVNGVKDTDQLDSRGRWSNRG